MARTQYIGVVVNKGRIVDTMLYGNKQECIDNLEDACRGRYADNTDAKVFEHVDLDDGNQTCVVVYDAYAPEVA